MTRLQEIVKDLMETIDEEFVVINSLQSTRDLVIEKQEEKIRETALTLLPVMERIREKGYYFRGKDTTYVSAKGPILKHDSREGLLYIFSVAEKLPITLDLHDEEVKFLSYRKLLKAVDFSTVMENLLLVLSHHQYVQGEIQQSIDELEEELADYENKI
jgi:hypothetical protein